MAFTFAAPRTLRATPRPAPLLTLPFFFIGLAGLPGAVTFRATPRLPPPLALPKSASGLPGTAHPAGNLAPAPAAHVDFFFIGLAGLPEPRTLRATSRPALPLALPKSASGLPGISHPARNPAPSRAANAAFFFIGLAGLPAPRTLRATPHLAAPPALPKSAGGRVYLSLPSLTFPL